MKHFLITSHHSVHVDSYELGEQEHANSYSRKEIIQSEDWRSAVDYYFSNVLYYNCKVEDCEIDDGQDSLQTSLIVDNENAEASPKEIEAWKAGRMTLYSNLITITVQEIIDVNLS